MVSWLIRRPFPPEKQEMIFQSMDPAPLARVDQLGTSHVEHLINAAMPEDLAQLWGRYEVKVSDIRVWSSFYKPHICDMFFFVASASGNDDQRNPLRNGMYGRFGHNAQTVTNNGHDPVRLITVCDYGSRGGITHQVQLSIGDAEPRFYEPKSGAVSYMQRLEVGMSPGLNCHYVRCQNATATIWLSVREPGPGILFVLSGEGVIELDQNTAVAAGDYVLIPPRVAPRVTGTLKILHIFQGEDPSLSY